MATCLAVAFQPVVIVLLKTRFPPAQWLLRDKMRARLFLLALVASFGYFTFGLAVAWPAAALPSIRFDLICMSLATAFFHPVDCIHCNFYLANCHITHVPSLFLHTFYLLYSIYTFPPNLIILQFLDSYSFYLKDCSPPEPP